MNVGVVIGPFPVFQVLLAGFFGRISLVGLPEEGAQAVGDAFLIVGPESLQVNEKNVAKVGQVNLQRCPALCLNGQHPEQGYTNYLPQCLFTKAAQLLLNSNSAYICSHFIKSGSGRLRCDEDWHQRKALIRGLFACNPVTSSPFFKSGGPPQKWLWRIPQLTRGCPFNYPDNP